MPALCIPSPPTPNSHRDEANWGRHPRNCHGFWHVRAAILVAVITYSPSCFRRISTAPTVTDARVVLIMIRCRVPSVRTVNWIGVFLILHQPSKNYEPCVNLPEAFYDDPLNMINPLQILHKQNVNNTTGHRTTRGEGNRL